MTVSFRSSATATQTPGTDGISVTVTKPSGTVNGDLMIAVTHGYTADTFTAPSGWKFLTFVDDSTGLRSRAYWKVASSEGANYQWQFQPGPGGGTIGVSIATFQNAGGLDSWDVVVTSTTDPSVGNPLTIARDSIRYSVYVWRDTTADAITWASGTEAFDINAIDSGTIVRGQTGAYGSSLFTGGTTMTAGSANPTNSVTHGIHWSFAIADTSRSAEDWDSTGFGVEMELDGTWTDVTPYVQQSKGISTSQGTSSEGGDTNPGTMNVTLRNDDGRFSPPNPSGANYGGLALNTKGRWWEAAGDVGMLTTGQFGERFRTSQTDSNYVAGDMDVRVDAEPRTWRSQQVLAAQAEVFQSSLGAWVFYVDNEAHLHLAIGTSLLTQDVKSTQPVPEGIRQTVRVTIDVNNGASGNDVKFYTSDSTTGSFTQLGATVTTSGTVTIGNAIVPIPLTVGSVESDTLGGRAVFPPYSPFRGRIYEMMLKDGIAGTTVANPVFSSQTTGTYDFTDGQGNVWSGLGGAVCTNRRYMFHGELAAAPLSWDTTGNYVVANCQFAGVLRRVQRNEQPTRSAMYRYYTSKNGIYTTAAAGAGLEGPYFPVAYWPLEDEAGAQTVASALPGGHVGRINGSPVFADYNGFDASDPIVHLVTASQIWLGVKAHGEVTGGFAVEFLLSAPAGMTHTAAIIDIRTSGTDRVFRLTYPNTDTLNLTTYDDDWNAIDTTGDQSVDVAGELLKVTIAASGGTGRLYVQALGDVGSTQYGGSSLTTSTIGRITSVTVNGNATTNDVYVGHVAVFDGTQSPNGVVYASLTPGPALPSMDPLAAFDGENAGDRCRRLIEEEGLASYGVGGSTANISAVTFSPGDNGVALGTQTSQSFIQNLRTAETADMGMLYEARDCFGIGYRTRASIYNQPPVLTLDYSNGELSGDLLPDYDDLQIKNRVTASKSAGSSYTFELTSGARGSDTVGVYPDSVTVSLEDDDQTRDQAGWRVRLNTVPEYRFPGITLAAENKRVAADATLTLGLLQVDLGDRVVIQNPPSWMPPEDVSQIVVGVDRTRTQFQHGVILHTVPESPYHVGVVGSSTRVPRASSADSVLDASCTSSATTIEVASTDFRWVDSTNFASSYPFDIVVGGERMTVTACTDTSSPQTFTVTRSVNGVVKAHDAGESVNTFDPTHAAY